MDWFHHVIDLLHQELSGTIPTTMIRLVVAVILGAVIGLERELRHKPAGLRTNLFICFGSALFTIMSNQLASGFGGDHTRIAAQIIPGIGFIGAGAILHSRLSVTGLTTAATLFVAAAVGMAAGGGLYITAIFSTIVILLALAVLGKLEGFYELKEISRVYEVLGPTTSKVLQEINRVLDELQLGMQEIHSAETPGGSRVVFQVGCSKQEHSNLIISLHKSNVFSNVQSLGSMEGE